MWEWIIFGVGQVLALAIGASDVQAADGPNPLIGTWKGSWESAMTPHRGPIELTITSADGDRVDGTGSVGGPCGAKLVFGGKMVDGQLVLSENLSRPCGMTTLSLKPSATTLQGSYRSSSDASEGGPVQLVKQ